MGQRHQMFIIARFRRNRSPPDFYRCIAAFHHQWCYGTLPLAAAHRFITLISQPENAAIARTEMQSFAHMLFAGEETDPHTPCPYILSLLGSTSTTNLDDEEFYCSGVTLQQAALPVTMGCWDGDNNDGITVIDITDPEKPAYCFMPGDETNKTGRHGETPYTAREYLAEYYNVEAHEQCMMSGVGDGRGNKGQKIDAINGNTRQSLQLLYTFNERPLITADMLREVWPQEQFKYRETPNYLAADAGTNSKETGIVPTLADITLEAIVKRVVEEGNPVDPEQLSWLPGAAAQVVDVLREIRQIPASAGPLMRRALEGLVAVQSPRLDLSRLELTKDEIVELLSTCHSVTESLDLSFNTAIRAGDIPAIVAAAPCIRRLILIECEGVEEDELFELLRERPKELRALEGILHPALLAIEKPDPYPSAFSYVAKRKSGSVACASIPMFTPAQIIQALCDLIPWKTQAGTPGPRPGGIMDGTLSIERGLPMIGASALQGRAPRRRIAQSATRRVCSAALPQSPAR